MLGEGVWSFSCKKQEAVWRSLAGEWCSQSCVCSKILLWLGLEGGQAGDARQGAKDEAVPIGP